MRVTVSCDCNLLSPKAQHDHTCLVTVGAIEINNIYADVRAVV